LALGIIHGDIKPENVLIFEDEFGVYTASVIDFGYSTRFANEDDTILVPKSWPWHAPEHHDNGFKPAQARKMDVFSFGMLCLYILFEKYLSGSTPLPEEALWAREWFQIEGKTRPSTRVLHDLKEKEQLISLARQLLMADKVLDEEKQMFEEFFRVSLVRDPDLREQNIKRSFGRLIPNR
jgi:serine/threonine protein kinase